MAQYEYRAAFLFSGMGALAHGILNARARLGQDVARFTFAGAVDVNPLACEAFEYLTGHKATCADVSQLTYEDMRRIFGEEPPDYVAQSPPCKGFSRLLPKKAAELEHYQRLNRLVLQGIELMGAWGGDKDWRRLPGTIGIENVQGIFERGEKLLLQVKQRLHAWGYVFHEYVHDLGEFTPDPSADFAGPAHRPRYLLLARHPKKVPAFIHNPPKRPLRGCGTALFELPLPDDPDAGPLHRSPKSGLITLARLAAIPKGKDWRALPMGEVDQAARRAWEQKGKKEKGQGPHWFKGKHMVMDPESPSRTVVAGPSNGADNIADSRVGQLAFGHTKYGDSLGVMDPALPGHTVRGVSRVDNGPAAVADSRVDQLAMGCAPRAGYLGVLDEATPSPTLIGSHDPNHQAALADSRTAQLVATTSKRRHRHKGHYGVADPEKPTPTVTCREGVWEGALALADSRMSLLAPTEGHGVYSDKHRVNDPEKPARTVTSATRPGSGAPAVADSRMELLATTHRANRFSDQYRVQDPNEAARCITGRTDIQEGAPVIADSRMEMLARRTGSGPKLMGVLDPDSPAGTITANASPSGGNCAAAVADSRAEQLRAPRGCRNGFLGVLDPVHAATTVTASLDPYSGTAAVADGRGHDDGFRRGAFGRIILTFTEALDLLEKKWKPGPRELTPLIISPHDGWWHRPLTKLDLWRLQGLPLVVRGKVPVLPGNEGDQRELIGDAVPVPAAMAMGMSVGAAHLAATLGTWALSSTGYWVRKPDGYVQEDLQVDSYAMA